LKTDVAFFKPDSYQFTQNFSQALIEACSKAMEEHCGRYGGVSERTVRDDIKIMRSDILGFNAPIKSENGLYFYTNRNYSLASIFISDADLAK
jgi:predicted DNA-binding transcriptional regulator YafY